MRFTRNIFLTFIATLLCVSQFCACHVAYAATVMDQNSQMSAELGMSQHGVSGDGSHCNDPEPSDESCPHCDIVSEITYISVSAIDIQKPVETTIAAIIPPVLRLDIRPAFDAYSFVYKRWRPPLEPTPVSLKTRLLN